MVAFYAGGWGQFRASLKLEDAILNLNKIGEVLFGLYGVNELPVDQTIKSGYADFPDIGTGMNFAIDAYATPEDTIRGYYNLPSQEQMEKMISMQGNWAGEWASRNTGNEKGSLNFYMEGEYLFGELVSYENDSEGLKQPLDIKLFGNYFRIKGFYPDNLNYDKEVHNHFELEFFNDDTLLGINMYNRGKVIFIRTEKK